MAALDVEFGAVSDVEGKFARLAQLLGLADADHARGKVEHLWMACTTRGEADLPQWLVEKHLGPGGPGALVEAELGSWGSGRGDSDTRRVRISGAEERCLWMRKNHEQSSKGGKTRAATASRAGGRFTSRSLVESDQPKPAPSPSPSPSLFPEEEDLPRSAPPPRPRKEPTGDHGRVIAAFDQRFRERFGQPPTWGSKQAGQVKQLLAKHPADEVIRRIAILFDNPPAFLLNSPPDIATLVQHFDKLVQPASLANGTRSGPHGSAERAPRTGRVEPRPHTDYPDGDQPL